MSDSLYPDLEAEPEGPWRLRTLRLLDDIAESPDARTTLEEALRETFEAGRIAGLKQARDRLRRAESGCDRDVERGRWFGDAYKLGSEMMRGLAQVPYRPVGQP